MRKIVILVALAVWVGFTFTNAGATPIDLAVGDQYYVGQIIDCIPSSVADEVGYINNLITLGTGATSTQIGSEFYNRVDSTLNISFPAVTVLQKTDTGGPYTASVNSGYILGKYDADNPGAGGYVWYVTDPGDYVVPAKSPLTWDPDNGKDGGWVSYGLSHVSVSDSTVVPEPGILILLGLAMTAVGVGSRLIRKL